MAESFPVIRPGDRQLSASAANRQAESAERQASVFGAQGLGQIDLPGGAGSTAGPPDSLWIEILEVPADPSGHNGRTGPTGCAPAYKWQEVVRSDCDYIPPGDGRFGDITDFPAYEVNGNRDVPFGKRVRAWFAADGSGLEFEFCSLI
jgi:hypothetical protein